MAAGRHLGFRFRGHNIWTAWARHLKFGTALGLHEGNGGITKIGKNQNPRWPLAAILDFGLEAPTFEHLELITSNLAQG